MLLVGLLFLSFPTQIALATSETAFDYIKEGDRYEYKETFDLRTSYQDSSSRTLLQSRLYQQLDNELLIQHVAKEEGYVTVIQSTSTSVYKYNLTLLVSNSSLFYIDKDKDGLVEYFDVSISKPLFLLIPWESYSQKFDTFKEMMQNASSVLSLFMYSFHISPQRVEIIMEYKEENYFSDGWTSTQGSLIYNIKQNIIIIYNNFILNEYRHTIKRTVDSLVNASYLSNITYIQEQNLEYYFKYQGIFEKFGLWIFLGTGVVLTLIIISVIKAKKEKKLFKL